jgi:hypothetical protein
VWNSPLIGVDPFGLTVTVLNDDAARVLEGIVGEEDWSSVSIDDEGNLTIDATEEQLEGNDALYLLSQMAGADESFGVTIADELPVEEGGSQSIGAGASWSVSETQVSPSPAGFDCLVAVRTDYEATTVEDSDTPGQNRPVSSENLMFHEAAEGYLETTHRVPYAEAHPLAIAREMHWRGQSGRTDTAPSHPTTRTKPAKKKRQRQRR